MKPMHRLVIIGGGFGGLQAAMSVKPGPIQATLVDKRNFHLFQPLLYQVATGGLSPANIASPLRKILKRRPNVRVLLGEVLDIHPDQKKVILEDSALSYDTLIAAAGSTHHYFGHEDWAALSPGLKTIEDAGEIRRRVLAAFEKAESEADPDRIRSYLTFAVVGGGPTGVELAGALAEIARDTLRNEFRAIDPSNARIILVEGLDRVLQPYPSVLSEKAAALLSRLGVECLVGTFVTDIRDGTLCVRRGAQEIQIPAYTVLWAAGVKACPLAEILARRTGVRTDSMRRLFVEPDLTLPGHPEILVIGDMANFSHQNGTPLPAMAPVAVQQGKYAARLVELRLEGKVSPPFRYVDRGQMTTIGRSAAVARVGRFSLWGLPAWLLWLFVHLMMLVEFENRLLVLLQWAWNYFTRNRSARLITSRDGT